MRKGSWIYLALLLAGCSQKAAPRHTAPELQRGGESAVAPWQQGHNGPDATTDAATAYLGQTAPQWAEYLNSDDHAVRSQGSQALAELGEVGFPHLEAGMRSGNDAVRLACLQAISKPTLVDHPQEMVPILRNMLKDPEPLIRRAAAARLCWFGSRASPALPELRTVAQSDPLLDIRQVALVSIEIIQSPKAPPARETIKPEGN